MAKNDDPGIDVGIQLRIQMPSKKDLDKVIKEIKDYMGGKITTNIGLSWNKKDVNSTLNEIKTYIKDKPLNTEIKTNINQGAIKAQIQGIQNQLNKINLTVNQGNFTPTTIPNITTGNYLKQSLTYIGDEHVKTITDYNIKLGETLRLTQQIGKENIKVITFDNQKVENEIKKQTNLLNKKFQNALSLEVKLGNLSPDSAKILENQLNRYKNIIKQYQGKIDAGQLVNVDLNKLQNIENRIKRFYETIRIAEKDSQGFNFAKFDPMDMTKLNKSIVDVKNSEELKNKALLQGHKLLDTSISKTDQYIKVNQRLMQGNEIKNISVYIDKATGKMYQFSEAQKSLLTRTYTMQSAFKIAFEKIG